MFGSLGLPEILFILALALLIFGPRKLPEIGRTLGRALGEFRRATTDLKRSIDVEMELADSERTPPKPTPRSLDPGGTGPSDAASPRGSGSTGEADSAAAGASDTAASPAAGPSDTAPSPTAGAEDGSASTAAGPTDDATPPAPGSTRPK